MLPGCSRLPSSANRVPAHLPSALAYCLKMGGGTSLTSEKVCFSIEEGPFTECEGTDAQEGRCSCVAPLNHSLWPLEKRVCPPIWPVPAGIYLLRAKSLPSQLPVGQPAVSPAESTDT